MQVLANTFMKKTNKEKKETLSKNEQGILKILAKLDSFEARISKIEVRTGLKNA